MHLADLLTLPTSIMTTFKQGGFVVSICNRPWHSVAVDESHEMLINKDCKTSIVRPLPDYINRIACYMPYRSKALQNLKQEILPSTEEKHHSIQSPFSVHPNDKKLEQNIKAQMEAISTSKLLIYSTNNRGLINPFTDKCATPCQHHDLLNFRAIGEREFLQRIAAVILKQPSVSAPKRRHRL